MSDAGKALSVFEILLVTQEGAVNEVCIYKLTLQSTSLLKTT